MLSCDHAQPCIGVVGGGKRSRIACVFEHLGHAILPRILFVAESHEIHGRACCAERRYLWKQLRGTSSKQLTILQSGMRPLELGFAEISRRIRGEEQRDRLTDVIQC